MAKPKKVAVIGATGMAGQRFIDVLYNHPWFQIVSLHDSTMVGQTYGEARKGFNYNETSEEILNMKIKDNKEIDINDTDIIFSAVPSSIAKNLESQLAAVKPVISTASAYRYEDDVPIFLPIINSKHIEMLDYQKKKRGWKGFILPGPNCTTVGFSIALYPLYKKFGIKSIHMVCMQALSSAGYPGVPSYDILGNVIPYIPEEEIKVKKEIRKIFGVWDGSNMITPDFLIDVKSNRIPVINGCTESVFVEFKKETTKDEIITTWKDFKTETMDVEVELPSAPEQPIIYYDDPYRPQPRIDLEGHGMSILVGGLNETEFSNGFKFTVISNNAELGAGRGGVLSAEYLIAKNYI